MSTALRGHASTFLFQQYILHKGGIVQGFVDTSRLLQATASKQG